MAISINELLNLPVIQLFLSPACNLQCSYCSQISVHTQVVTDDFSKDEKLLQWIETIPSTHFYISGGEPLIHKGIVNFVKKAAEYNHKVSFDTNLTGSDSILAQLMKIDTNVYGFFNISHHLEQNISLSYIVKRCNVLKQLGIKHFIKYIGIPEDLDKIYENKKYLRQQGIGFVFTVFQHTSWKGRSFPSEYTLEELKKCFELVSFKAHALQFFDGIYSKGIKCRGGNDFIVCNMHGDRAVMPCCHSSSFKKSIKNTFFYTKKKKLLKCQTEICTGDLMFILGVNGVASEVETLIDICNGKSITYSSKEIFEYIESIKKKGYKIVDESKYTKLRKYINEF